MGAVTTTRVTARLLIYSIPTIGRIICSGGLQNIRVPHVAPNWDRAAEPLQWHISYGIFIGLIAKQNISIFITVICILVPADKRMAFVGIILF